jgi:transcriptional regulator with XRE-family HTH domain
VEPVRHQGPAPEGRPQGRRREGQAGRQLSAKKAAAAKSAAAAGADQVRGQLEGLGRFIRSQRTLANLSLRELAERTNVSNPYLSQIERGLHEPSVRVLRSIARALNLSAESLLAQVGMWEGAASPERGEATTEEAIRADPYLSDAQKVALLGVYRSYLAAGS